MKKILASLLAITMLMTTMSACVIPAQAEDATAVATSNVIFTETFEDYGEGNWLENLDENEFVTGIEKMDANTWKIYGSGHTTITTEDETTTTTANGKVEVVDNPDATGKNTSGKVLKLDAGTIADGWFRIRRNANGDSYLDRETDLNGKRMVIKANFYLPTGYKSKSDTGSFMYDQWEKSTRIWPNSGFSSTMSSDSWPMAAVGGGNYGSNAQAKVTATLAKGEWVEVKYVLDLSEYQTATHNADTYRGFYNGSVYSGQLGENYKNYYTNTNTRYHRTVHSLYPQAATINAAGDGVVLGEKFIDAWGGYNDNDEGTPSSFGDFYGLSFTLSGTTALTTDYLYMDNLTAYYIDKFEQSGDFTLEYADQTDWYKGEIRIPFTNNLMTVVKENGTELDDYASLFTLEDASGKVVENGIAAAYADGNELVIEPSSMIERNATYTIVADALFMDEEGQGLNQYSAPTEIGSFKAIVDPYAHIYFDEDFEDYTSIIGQNWASSVDTSTNYVTLTGVEENAWKIGSSAGTSSASSGSVKVVTDPKNSGRGNVLEIDTGSIASGKNITVLKTPGESTISRSTMNGKRIVIEGDIYIPADSTLDEDTTFAYYSGNDGMNASRPNSYILPYNSTTGANLYAIGSGAYGTIASGRSRYSAGGEWHTYRYVIDVSGTPSANRVDTVRGYIDGTLMVGVLSESTTTAATNANYPVYEADGTTPLQIVDFWKRIGVWDSTTASNYSAGDFYGVFMTARTKGGAVNKYYVDNMTAYYVDDLALTVPDLSDFTGGGINLTFNQEIPEKFDILTSTATKFDSKATEKTLADMFTILDKDGNDIDGIKDAKVSSDGKTVTILPQNIDANSDYTIVISRYFHDAEGQGLTKNSTEYEIDMHVGEFVPFELVNISQTSFSGFAQYRNAKVTAEFSMNISDDMIENGIVVTDSKGNEVARNSGWTATIDAENAKVVVFDFTNLPTDSYTVVANDNFAIAGEVLSNTLEITIEAAAQPIVLFDENFDTGYTLNENWLNDANATIAKDAGYTSGMSNYRTADGKWDIQKNAVEVNANDFVGIVDASEIENGVGFSGGVLKIDETAATTYSHALGVRRNFDIGAISLTSGEYKDKILVYEADIVNVPKMLTNTSSGGVAVHGMKVSRQEKKVYEYDNSGWKNVFVSGGGYRMQEGAYAGKAYGPIYMWQTAITTSGNTTGAKLRLVVDQSAEKDTMRMYFNGNLVSKAVPEVLKGHARNGMILADAGDSQYNGQTTNIGDTLYGIWNSAVDSTAYIDNFKAYLVDAFNIESVTGNGDVFNTAKATVDFTFSKAVDEDTVEGNVVLLDAEGNEVTGGIESATLSDGGYKLSVDLYDELQGKTKYTIKIKDGLADVDGIGLSKKYYYYNTYNINDHYTALADGTYDIDVAGTVVNCTYTERTDSTPATLKRTSDGKYVSNIDCYLPDYSLDGMKTEVTITTSKATSLFAEAGDATVSGSTVTTNVTITNPETTDMDVWCVVAAFGEYNEMLGCTPVTIKSVAAGSAASEPVTITGINGTVKSVKMFVWNSYEDMKPYHKAENIYTAE